MEPLGPSLLIVGVAALALPFCDRTSNRTRTVLFGVCILLAARYVVWRFAASLPAFTLGFESIFAWTFAVIEALAITGSVVAFATLSRTRNRSAEATAARPWLDALPRPPRVDVLIATYNEDQPTLTRTIVGAIGIGFPGVRVCVLDDGRRPWLAELCASLGARYVTRPDNKHAKAGNINHALALLRDDPDPPEFIAVFDADFVPYPNFLHRTLPLFRDGAVGLVQTPQHFFNHDPIQSNLLLGGVWPDEQRFFFDHMLPAKDAWGAAFCCGTSSIIRLRALEAIGGFPTESVTEDCLVTIKLDRAGWRTIYLGENLSAGLAPEGMKEYVTQRGRWCLGTIQIFRSSNGPFSRGRMSLSYRIGLIDAFLYWAVSFAFKFLCLTVPIAYWFFGVQVVIAPLGEAVQYFLPYCLSVMIILAWATDGTIQPVMTDVTHLLTMFEAIKASATGLLRPHGHKFKVTAKGGDRSRLLIQWPLLLRFGAIAVLTLGGMLYASLSDYAPGHDEVSGRALIVFWSIYNIIVLLLAMAVCVELPRYRREERFAAAEPAHVVLDGAEVAVEVTDLSIGGARLRCPALAPVGASVVVIVQNVGALPATVVAATDTMTAIAFDPSTAARDTLIRKLFSGRYGNHDAHTRMPLILKALAQRLQR